MYDLHFLTFLCLKTSLAIPPSPPPIIKILSIFSHKEKQKASVIDLTSTFFVILMPCAEDYGYGEGK